MNWLFFGVLILLATILAAQLYVRSDPKTIAKSLKLSIALFIAIVTLPIWIRLSPWISIPLIGSMLYFSLSSKNKHSQGAGTNYSQSSNAKANGGGSRQSGVETATLRMILDHDTGAIDGEVLAGPFKGRSLSDLTIDELVHVMEQCQSNDRQAAELLQAYVNRHRAEEWRQHGFEERAANDQHQDQSSGSHADGNMTEQQALEILGLSAASSNDEIKAAHRAMMKKFHPDHGGSSYLAAKINQAKEILLRRHSAS